MQIEPFALERYFARHEFTARHLLSPSDCESLSLSELLALADPETRGLWENLSLGYTESPGHPLLREEIAGMYAGLSADHILTAAPEEAIFLAMNALLRPGDRVLVLTPAYQSLHSIARALGCQVEDWPLAPRDGAWTLDLELLDKLLRKPARLVVVNFPNNPTGFLPNGDEWQLLVDRVARSGAFLFSDEMYRLLEHDPSLRLPPACERYERAINLAGLSKSFGLPGLRAGWLASADRDLLSRIQVLKDYTTICASAPGEILSIIALRAREGILARCRSIVAQNLAAARAFFSARPALFEWLEPGGGSIAFPRWLGPQPVEQLAEELVTERGLMLVPGSMFGGPGKHFRVGLGRGGLGEILGILGEYIANLV
jgi:aspartate/methionine/tyrosine aminotransferase